MHYIVDAEAVAFLTLTVISERSFSLKRLVAEAADWYVDACLIEKYRVVNTSRFRSSSQCIVNPRIYVARDTRKRTDKREDSRENRTGASPRYQVWISSLNLPFQLEIINGNRSTFFFSSSFRRAIKFDGNSFCFRKAKIKGIFSVVSFDKMSFFIFYCFVVCWFWITCLRSMMIVTYSYWSPLASVGLCQPLPLAFNTLLMSYFLPGSWLRESQTEHFKESASLQKVSGPSSPQVAFTIMSAFVARLKTGGLSERPFMFRGLNWPAT